MSNTIYVGTSLDGYIADRNDGLEFLECVPNPGGDDLGFADFMNSVDALLMGRKTYEVVLSFGIEWPYTKHVFVYSSSLTEVPEELAGRVTIVTGELEQVISQLNGDGYKRLYVDGGELIKALLKGDRIDEMVVTRVPILLGGGTPLFGDLPGHLAFEHVRTEVLLGQLVKSTYRRSR